jgi:hypothetical protein
LRHFSTLGIEQRSEKVPISFDLICEKLRVKRFRIRNGFVTNFLPLPRRAQTQNCPRESRASQQFHYPSEPINEVRRPGGALVWHAFVISNRSFLRIPGSLT